MRTIALLVVAALAAGCGGGSSSDPLSGTQWGLDSTTVQCSVVLSFGRGGDYVFAEVCALNDGTNAVQEELGQYDVDGNQLTTNPHASTCRGVIGETDIYGVSGNQLTIQTPSALLVFQRVTASGSGTFAGALGCFDDQGLFTPQPLAPT